MTAVTKTAGKRKVGDGTPGPGRPKGSVNKATVEARKAIADFVDGNAHRLVGWLDRVAEDNPAKAFELFQSVVEYHVPKLARTIVEGGDTPLKHDHTVGLSEAAQRALDVVAGIATDGSDAEAVPR